MMIWHRRRQMETAGDDVFQDNFIIGSAHAENRHGAFATPAIRALGLGVELNDVNGTGKHGLITAEDVEKLQKLRRFW